MNFTKLSYEIVQSIRSEVLELSQALHAHPEVAFEEVFAKDTQIKLLQKLRTDRIIRYPIGRVML